MLELGFERLESEPGCFVKKGVSYKGHDHCGCACGRSLECWEAITSRQLLCATGENVETQACRVHWRMASQCCSWVTTSQSSRDKITLKSKGACVDNMLAMLGMESCKPTNTPMVRKESAANDNQEMLEGSKAETYRSAPLLLCCLAICVCTAKEHVSDQSSCVALSFDSHTWKRSGAGRGGASLWFAVFEWYKCRPLVRNHRVAKKRPCRQLVVTSSNTQWVRFRDCWEDRSASQDVKMNGIIGVARSGIDSAPRTVEGNGWLV